MSIHLPALRSGTRMRFFGLMAALMTLAGAVTTVAPTPASASVRDDVQVQVEVQDDAIKTTMWTTKPGCLYFSMDITRSDRGGRLTPIASKRAKHCHEMVTWTVSAKQGAEHLVQVSASPDKKNPERVKSARVMPGVGLAPQLSPPRGSVSLRVSGTITINDAIKGLDRRGGLETFPVDRTYIVGPGVVVQTDIGGCVGRDTGARTRLNIASDGEAVDVEGTWLFSETNSPRKRSCYGNVAKRLPIEERIDRGDDADFNAYHKKGGNWAETDLTMTNDVLQVTWVDA